MTAVSLVIPTYKERDNIAPLVERIHAALRGYDYRVLFVDDDSNDGTAELVKSLSAQYPVDIFIRKNRRGLATAVVDGLQQVTGDTVVVMDADLQHPPEVLADLLKKIDGGADMVIASRYVPGGGCEGWGLARRLNSKGAIFLAHLLLPATRLIKDPVSGYFGFKLDRVAAVDLRPIGYKIVLEILMVGKFQNVAEVPFTFVTRRRGQSKLSARQQIEYLKHIYSLMKRSGELRRLLKFMAVGLSGTAVNLGVLRLVRVFTAWNPYAQLVPGIEISIITNFLLNDYFTFSDRRTGKARSLLGRLLRYNLVSFMGAAINYGTAALLFSLGLNIYLADLIGILVAFVWNYLLSLGWAWK